MAEESAKNQREANERRKAFKGRARAKGLTGDVPSTSLVPAFEKAFEGAMMQGTAGVTPEERQRNFDNDARLAGILLQEIDSMIARGLAQRNVGALNEGMFFPSGEAIGLSRVLSAKGIDPRLADRMTVEELTKALKSQLFVNDVITDRDTRVEIADREPAPRAKK